MNDKSLGDFVRTDLSRTIRNMNTEDFFKFISEIPYISQIEYTTNKWALKNLQTLLTKLNTPEIRGTSYDCIPLEKTQFKDLQCYNPNIIKYAQKYGVIKKIGAESENGIVFLLQIGNFKCVLKTALLYDADPLDYEFHIQSILNPIRNYVPNYSMGLFYFHCNTSPELQMKEIILNQSIAAVQGAFSKNFPEYEGEDIVDFDYKTNKKIPKQALTSYNNLHEYLVNRITTLDQTIDSHVKLYKELINTLESLDIRPLCVDAPKPLESFRGSERLNNLYRKKAAVELGTANLFIATEFTENPESLDNYCENLGVDGRNHITLMNILIQVFCALQAGADRYKFTHYDLHAENVLLTKLPEPRIFVYQFNNKNMPFVPIYTEYLVTIIDFGRSYVKGKQMYFDIKKSTSKEKEYLFGDDEDTNITTNKFNACFDMVRLMYYIYGIRSVKKARKKYLTLRDFFALFKRDFKGRMSYGKDNLTYPYSTGKTIKSNLDFIDIIYKNGGIIYIPYDQLTSDVYGVYLFNTYDPKDSTIKNITASDFKKLDDAVRNPDFNWTLDKANFILSRFYTPMLGGSKRKKKPKKITKKLKGGSNKYMKLTEQDRLEADAEIDELKPVLTKMKPNKKKNIQIYEMMRNFKGGKKIKKPVKKSVKRVKKKSKKPVKSKKSVKKVKKKSKKPVKSK